MTQLINAHKIITFKFFREKTGVNFNILKVKNFSSSHPHWRSDMHPERVKVWRRSKAAHLKKLSERVRSLQRRYLRLPPKLRLSSFSRYTHQNIEYRTLSFLKKTYFPVCKIPFWCKKILIIHITLGLHFITEPYICKSFTLEKTNIWVYIT